MTCPVCQGDRVGVRDTTPVSRVIKRRRYCMECQTRWTTEERTLRETITTPTNGGHKPPLIGVEAPPVMVVSTPKGRGLGGEGVGLLPGSVSVSSVLSVGSKQSGSGSDARRRKSEIGATHAFNTFWELYPRKVAKQAAQRAWYAQACESITETIFAALEWQAPLFAQRDAEHIPHPASWLNGKRWTDAKPSHTNGVPTKAAQSRAGVAAWLDRERSSG